MTTETRPAIRRLFNWSALNYGICLGFSIFALGKFLTISESGGSSIDQADYVLKFLSRRESMTIAAVIELVLIVVCFLKGDSLVSWLSIATVTSALFAYRVILISIAGFKPCSCIGALARLLHLDMRLENALSLAFLIACLAVACYRLTCSRAATPPVSV